MVTLQQLTDECYDYYLNCPGSTPESELLTEVLFTIRVRLLDHNIKTARIVFLPFFLCGRAKKFARQRSQDLPNFQVTAYLPSP